MTIKKPIYLIIAIVICQLAGVIGSFFTVSSVKTWYLTLAKPSFQPPSWLFSPVWITLFVLMGISLYLILLKKNNRQAIIWFSSQLVLNILWSVIFFGMQQPTYAFIEIIVLWIAILVTIIKCYKLSKSAAYLMMPYILWVTFAAVLNFAIAYLN